jgi:hypothetical protein
MDFFELIYTVRPVVTSSISRICELTHSEVLIEGGASMCCMWASRLYHVFKKLAFM